MSLGSGLEITGLSKTFGPKRVLADVDLKIAPGEVHGLVGQNGSGKSTLIKILSGYHTPDPGGAVSMNGVEMELPPMPEHLRELGLVFVHQDLALIETASIVENMRMGRYETHFPRRISWGQERRATQAVLDRFALDAKPDTMVAELPQVERALLAILRALDQVSDVEGGLLVLDEPTAYLPNDGAERLFGAVAEVAGSGFGVLLVTHRLAEITDHTSRVTVLRDGGVVLQAETEGLGGEEAVSSAMLGFDLEDLYPDAAQAESRTEAIRVTGLRGPRVAECDFVVHAGEVLGLAGLVGMGHNYVPGLVFGALPAEAGTLKVGEKEFDLTSFTPAKAMAAGLAYVPANRLRDSGLGEATVTENLSLPTLGRYFRGGRLRLRQERKRAAELTTRFDVRPNDPAAPLTSLSGGNQQKVLLAKWFERAPQVLMMDEPTQGVDIGSRKQIFAEIRNVAESGSAVVIASAELEDLAHLCDRILILRDGRVAAELVGSALTPERLALLCLSEEREIRPPAAGANGSVSGPNGNQAT